MRMLYHIGHSTMNVTYINERRPVLSRCYTREVQDAPQCMLAARESVLRRFDLETPPLSVCCTREVGT